MSDKPSEKVWTEELEVSGHAVVDTVKGLLHQGNVRRITIKNTEGKTVTSIPVTVGVIGALVAPTLAAVGAVVAMAEGYKIVVEREAEVDAPA